MDTYPYHRIFELDRELRTAGADEPIISKIMVGGDKIVKTSKKEAIGVWLADAMDRIDKLVPFEIAKKARMSNACSISGARLQMAKKIATMNLPVAQAIEEVEKEHFLGFNGAVRGYSVKLDGNRILVNFGFGRCWCHCAYAGRKVSITYCYCCLGHVLRILGVELERELKGEVVGTTCSGNAPCRFEVCLD